jgi:hypothetical protein
MSNATQLDMTSLITPPPVGFNPMALSLWCEANGIDRRSSMTPMYERNDFTLSMSDSGEWEITVWVNSAKVDGVWVDGHTKVVATFSEMNAGLMDLASR